MDGQDSLCSVNVSCMLSRNKRAKTDHGMISHKVAYEQEKKLRITFTQPWRIGQTNQNTFWAQQTGHRLTPWLFPCYYQELVAFCFQLLRGLGNIFYVKFEPGDGSR